MSSEIVEQWSKAARGALATVKSWSELSVNTFERITAQQLELAQANVDLAVRAGRLLNESKSYQDLASGQAALANEYGQRLAKIVRSSNELASELRDEYASWTEGQIRTAVAPFEKVAEMKVA